MADQPPSLTCNIDPYEHLKIALNADGTLSRLFHFLPTPATNADSNDDQSYSAVFTKDFPLSTANKTWVRIFRPRQLPPATAKLPIIIYYHGGGFILATAAWTVFHDFCAKMATLLPALIVSVEYRLAPEHRLPAAYEDGVDAIQWVRNQAALPDVGCAEDGLWDLADFSQCFLMGNSAGGNLAYHAGLRSLELDLEPVKIAGLILHHPFFGGVERTGSELRLINDPYLPLSDADLMWELSLPISSDRDHGYCNPMVDAASNREEKIGLLGRWLVTGRGEDPLVDRQKEFVKMLEEQGVRVVAWFEEEGYHGMENFDLDKAQALFMVIKDFISSLSVLCNWFYTVAGTGLC